MCGILCVHDTIAIEFTQEERVLVAEYAGNAILPVGFHSDIWDMTKEEERARREAERPENQYTGMAAEAAWYKWSEFAGSGGFNGFVANRKLRDKDKFKGDNGVDCILAGGRVLIDVKGSEPMRGMLFDEDTAMKLHLTHKRAASLEAIRNIIYVFALTKRALEEACIAPYVVLLVGWLYGHELYGRTDKATLEGWSARGGSLRKMHELEQLLLSVAPSEQVA